MVEEQVELLNADQLELELRNAQRVVHIDHVYAHSVYSVHSVHSVHRAHRAHRAQTAVVC